MTGDLWRQLQLHGHDLSKQAWSAAETHTDRERYTESFESFLHNVQIHTGPADDKS